MINGFHSIIYPKDAKADSIFFRDVLKLPNVDVGNGWLIFALPPSALAVHPVAENMRCEFFLMCDDIRNFVNEMVNVNIPCSEIAEQHWGLITRLTLPGGGKIGVYEPRHAARKPPSI
jgi:hypothetical protein